MAWTAPITEFSVTIEVTFSVPYWVVHDAISTNPKTNYPAGYDKIRAIKDVREWAKDQHGYHTGLKDTKEMVDFVAARMKAEGKL